MTPVAPDARTAPARAGGQRARVAADRLMPPLAFAVLILAVWQAVSAYQPDSVLPSPWHVARTTAAVIGSGELPSVAWRSLWIMAVGYGVSALAGIGLGLLLADRPLVDRAVSPYFIGLQSLPSAAWVPVTVIFLGAGRPAVLAVTVLGALPSIATGTRDAVHGIPPLLVRAAGTLGARGRTMLTRVMLPAALPGIVTGLSSGWAFAFRALVAAELISGATSTGLGVYLNTAQKHGQVDRLLAGVLVIMAVGIAVDRLVFARAQRRMRERRGLVEAG